MRNSAFISLLSFALLSFCFNAISQSNQPRYYKLWYQQAASNWNEALPIGNGRLGAMIFGNAEQEKLQLNEETVWAGEPGNNVVDGLYPTIQQVRQLIFEGRYKEAQELAMSKIPRQAAPDNNYGMPYQPVGNLMIQFPELFNISDYYRDLDIQNAVATVSYKAGDVTYKREFFSSLVDGVIIVRLSASKPKSISCNLLMNSPHKVYAVKTKGNLLVLSGRSGDVDNKKGKVQFEAQVLPKIEGGRMQTTDSSLQITGADVATLYISIGTNFKSYKDLSGDASAKAAQFLSAAVKKNYPAAKAEHIKKYRNYFDRVSLNLGISDAMQKPTNVRISDFAKGRDPQLAALYFQFGRYLLISSSQPGTQPANLQGIWNDKVSPPWDSKYTININTEMNYWPAEVTNLPEMHQPLFSMIKDLSQTGRESASKMYHARGWNAHHNTDLWRITGPVDGAFYGMWPMGGAWLTQHVWQHYLFTGDQKFLKDMYPVLKGAALYYVDVLQEEPKNKWLVVAPSMSPENSHQSGVSMTAGTTMDNQLVFDVLSNAVAAARILNVDNAFSDTLKATIQRLPPMQIGQHNQLQEWLQDLDRPEDKHRHISHLYGLYPSNQVSPYSHPELFDAARTSLVYRGDKSTGWSMGWKVNWWARLLDGNRAYKLIQDQLSPAPVEQSGQNGGTYPNLFDAHPPFQIDGNFGCTAGISEMLVQSHDGAIHILPALPDAWPSGTVKGMVARGGYILDIIWKDGRVNEIKVRSKLGGNCRIRLHDPLKAVGQTSLREAKGENPNPFYAVAQIKQPLISEKAKRNPVDLRKTFVYDLPTKVNGVYVLKAE